MVRHRLERLMRLTQGAALVAVAACNSSESKPNENITPEKLNGTSAATSTNTPTINAVATPVLVMASATPSASAAAETPAPAASASASASASAAAPPPKAPPATIGAPTTPIRVNSPRRPNPPHVNSPYGME